HVGGGDPGHGRLRIRVEDGRGPGAADPAGGRDLPPEAGPELLVQREVRVHDLHRDRTTARAAAQVDPSHAAGAEPAEQPVGPDGGRFIGSERLHGVHLSPGPPGTPHCPKRSDYDGSRSTFTSAGNPVVGPTRRANSATAASCGPPKLKS